MKAIHLRYNENTHKLFGRIFMSTTIIAHRGASYLANHENTIEAFQLALDIHSDYIELDIRQTLDKVLIVFHDEQIGGVSVNTLTYRQIHEMTDTLGYQIPTFEEVLAFCQKKVHLLIELKEAGYEKRVLSLVNTYFSYDEYAIQSFFDIVVRRIKKIDSNVHAGLLIGLKNADFRTHFNEFFPIRRITECHADFVSTYYKIATPDFVIRMQHAKIPVYVWTLDIPKQIQYYLELEVDGIITNRPDVGIYLRSQWEKEEIRSEEIRTKTYNMLKKAVHILPHVHQKKKD